MENTIIKLDNVVKRYGKKEALKGISLDIPKGKIVGLLGPNGSGKSTMIKLLNGLLQPDEGSIEIAGMKPSIETKKIVSYLPERTYLSEWMKMKDLLKFFSDFYEDFDLEKAEEMIEALNINVDEKIKDMSKGTKEKVQLILVMSRNADVYILDEPIGGVDPAARSFIMRTILQNFSEESTLIIATHLISEIENICDEIIFLSYGEIKLQGNVDEIREEKGKSIDALFREEFRC
ncbi:ABC transporter ATP-binding protein [Peptacetobacter sp.]|uniref:ABC transporter ATP-binding protein n=1 Tax=Peptacetobacter sp. TaxID=2991975 RepID=UPI002614BAD4|nr:ABC transporter ATP-binding protein [Peptacetobacter sp.]MEE0452269.1 ABC transporter ATP-binding protein [Peptacetobacter sp.]